jgi:hypothetical protein
MFTERTITNHESNIMTIINDQTNMTHYKGVKGKNCFSTLLYFHIIQGLPLDLMHDLLEGCLMKNFGCLMTHLKKSRLYSVDQLNTDLKEFKYNRHDGQNKVPHSLFKKGTKVFRLSATHAWTLIRIFPIINGEKFVNDKYYKHFMLLIEIFQMLTGDSFEEIILKKLEDKIESYLNNWKMLYPEVKLTAKLHNLVHYPRCIRMFGPPLDYWTMRFDSKHQYLKRVHKAIHNHINLLKSLADRHQFLQLSHLMCTKYFPEEWDCGTIQIVNSDILDYISLNIKTDKFSCYNYLTYNSVKYTVNDTVVIKKTNSTQLNKGLPEFGKICTIVKETSSNLIYFILEPVICKDYLNHYSGYKVECANDFLGIFLNIIKITELAHLDFKNNLIVIFI